MGAGDPVRGGASARAASAGSWTFAAGLGVTLVLGIVAAGRAGVAATPAAGTAPDPVPGSAGAPVEVERTVAAMGTTLRGRALAPDRPSALAALEVAFDAVAAEEALLSTWREDTELARLNGAPAGEALRVDARLHGLLAEAWEVSEETGGAFDPAVGALVAAWDLRGEGRRPPPQELRAARAATGRDCFALGPGRRVTPRCEGAWIDGGAFGKGSALRRARAALNEAGIAAALLDFGGQLVALGSPTGEDGWPAAVAHPADRDRPVVRLALRDRSAATTSSSERFVVIDGEPRGHVLDPRSGRPVPAWGSVTVVARDPLRADALSTGLFVMGPERAMGWAQGRDDAGVLVVELADDGDLVVCWNDAMEPYVRSTNLRRETC